jgi:DNA polymerase-3 subunit beta
MKFTINREALLRPLQLVTGVVERRQTLPVLANLLVVARNGALELTGTDLEVELKVTVGSVDVEQEGEATIPARKLADIWRSLPDEAEVRVSVEGDRSIVRSGRSRFTLSTLPAGDFPRVEGGAGDTEFKLSQEGLHKLIAQVSFAMAQQDVRYFLNGMLLEVTPDHVRTVATDGHRLAMATQPCSSPVSGRVQAIVPRKGVTELSRLLDGEDDATVMLGKNHVSVRCGDYVLTSKLVDGQFPDYEKVVPRDTNRSVVGDRTTLKQAFLRASILSNEKYRGVRLTIEPEQLTVRANNPDQEEAEETVPISFDGEPLEIGFNVSYLQDVLNVMESNEIHIGLSDTNNSALIESPGVEGVAYVVMPMRL